MQGLKTPNLKKYSKMFNGGNDSTLKFHIGKYEFRKQWDVFITHVNSKKIKGNDNTSPGKGDGRKQVHSYIAGGSHLTISIENESTTSLSLSNPSFENISTQRSSFFCCGYKNSWGKKNPEYW